MAYRVIQWGTGGVGTLALREILLNPLFQLVGVKVYSAVKAGKDAGELCEMPATGIRAVLTMEELALEPGDTVFYAPLIADHEEIVTLLERGVNVVTTANNLYPALYGALVFDRLDQAGKRGGARLHGSGMNPGFVSDVLPLTLSGLTHRARHISIQALCDVGAYTAMAPEVQLNQLGYGKLPADALQSSDFLKAMTNYFTESMRMICDHMGVTLQRVDEDHEVACATAPIHLDKGYVIQPGTVACRWFRWYGVVRGKRRIDISALWKLSDQLDPPWEVACESPVQWTVVVEGTPSVKCVLTACDSFDPGRADYLQNGSAAGIVATATHTLNAIPLLMAAPPGVCTLLDLPVIPSCGAFSD